MPTSHRVESVAAPPLLRVAGLSMTFPGQKALDNVDLEIQPGEVHALLGQNGCGKSTLIKVLTGYHTPDPGVRYWVGNDSAQPRHGGLHTEHGENLEIRAVHQDLGLIDRLNAVDNIGLLTGFASTRGGSIGWKEQARRTRDLLSKVGADDLDVWRPLDQCSKLHRTQVAIARVLARWESGRGLLILDEPTASLQGDEVARLFAIIRELQSGGISVLYVSHRLAEIFQVADRLTVLREGRVVGTRSVAEVDHDTLITMMLGSLTALDQDAEGPTPAVEARDRGHMRLRVSGLNSAEMRGLDFTLRSDEILGFAGVVGSGQEELPYLLTGATRARAGTLWIEDQEYSLSTMTPRRARQQGLGLVPPDRATQALIMQMSVTQNLTLPTLADFQRQGRLRPAAETAFAQEWATRLQLAPNQPSRIVGLLSGGNQQKVVIGKGLSVARTALILAEPTAGVDIGAKALIYRHLRGEAAAGTPMIVCSSDVTDLVELCTRVICLRDGQVHEELQGAEITEDRLLRAILKPAEERV